MRFEEWEPIYLQILDEFRYSRLEDEKAAALLERLILNKRCCDEPCLAHRIRNEVTVCGASDSLHDNLISIGTRGTVIAADAATKALMDQGIIPDIIVTDLDGDIPAHIKANEKGSLLIVHAHGDNILPLSRFVPLFNGEIVATTQSTPFRDVRNYGGFTDGDRAVMLARHFGATRVHLLGFDFQHPMEKEGRERSVKLRKLEWARKLIFDLNPAGTCLSIP